MAGVAGAAGAAQIGEDDEDYEGSVQIDHYAAKVQKARDLAQSDPKAVANIIREWMNAGGS